MALLVWVVAQLAVALITAESSSARALSTVAAVLCSVTCVAVLAPLHAGRRALHPLAAASTALLAPIVGAVNALTTPAASLISYAQWWPGMISPLIAALVLRRRGSFAVLSCLACVVVLAVVFAPRPGPWLPVTAVMASPFLAWLVGSALIGRFFDAAATDLGRSRAVAARAAQDTVAASEAGSVRHARQELLATRALPLLELVASGSPTSPALLDRTLVVEADLRFELAGRDLVDEDVRTARRTAEERGVAVSVLDDGAPGTPPATLVQARRVVATTLRAAVDGSVTARRTAGADTCLTVVHTGTGASVSAVAAAAGGLAPRTPQLVVDADDECVVLELELPAGAEPA